MIYNSATGFYNSATGFYDSAQVAKKLAQHGWCSMQPGPAGGGKKEERTKYNLRVFNNVSELRVKVSIQFFLWDAQVSLEKWANRTEI